MIIILTARRSEAGRLRLVSERVLQASAHWVHLHTLVQSPRVPPHWRLLQPEDGYLECRLCLFWDHEVLLLLQVPTDWQTPALRFLHYLSNYVCYRRLEQILEEQLCCESGVVSVWSLSSREPMSWTRFPRSTMCWEPRIRASSRSSSSEFFFPLYVDQGKKIVQS